MGCGLCRVLADSGRDQVMSNYQKRIDRMPLAPREKELLAHLVRGRSTHQIGHLMGLSRHTVLTYIKRINLKTGLHHRTALVALACGTYKPEGDVFSGAQ